MKLSQFHYDLPPSLIAQEPVTPRDHSKLMVLNRQNNQIEHRPFYEIVDFLKPGDVLVTNATKVFPARLRGKKKTGGKVEVLLTAPLPDGQWKALIRGTARPAELVFPEGLQGRMTQRLAEGEWAITFSSNHLREYLDRQGEMPLPPYIKRKMRLASDLDRYQTVYADREGAVAAPTAGFHFTPELLENIRAHGVLVQSIVLHVGWGTFRPIRAEHIEDHKMLPETYKVSDETVQELNRARRESRRIVAVGTTVVRTLETLCDSSGMFRSGGGESDLFIYPGYSFKAVDALITNFHLPDSTPLLLACAFFGGNRSHPFSLKFAYAAAIREQYRFYSYGDAMLIQ